MIGVRVSIGVQKAVLLTRYGFFFAALLKGKMYICGEKFYYRSTTNMATFKAEVYKHQKRADGTWNVKVRVTHNRQKKYLSTPIYAKPEDITRSFKLKKNITDKTDKMIDVYEGICADLGLRLKGMSMEELIMELEKGGEPKNENIDFFAFANKVIYQLNKDGKTGSAKNYQTTIESLKRFIHRDILFISEITYGFMKDYEAYLKNAPSLSKKKKGDRSISLYPGYIRSLHNMAKAEYNDEEQGIIRIPWSPFSKYKVQKQSPTRKRNLPPEVIKKILDVKDIKGVGSVRYNLAKDVFALSFYLIGMNTADLFSCTIMENGRITYFRAKTRDRRSDLAEMSIRMEPEVLPLIEKYRDASGERVFNFYKKYADADCFNTAVNKGLKKVGEVVGVADLEFYAGRHSWATIARNDLKVNKYVVHEALNHVDDEMKVTDIYLEKDYSQIDEANRKVIDFVLTGKK